MEVALCTKEQSFWCIFSRTMNVAGWRLWLITLQSPPGLTALFPGLYDTQSRKGAKQKFVRVGIAVLFPWSFCSFFPLQLNTKDSNFKQCIHFFARKNSVWVLTSHCFSFLCFFFFYESNCTLRQSCISIQPIHLLLYILAKNYNSTTVEKMMWNGRHTQFMAFILLELPLGQTQLEYLTWFFYESKPRVSQTRGNAVRFGEKDIHWIFRGTWYPFHSLSLLGSKNTWDS